MAQMQVNVSWRDIPVLADVLLSEVEGARAFLRTKAPMPVGTMLIVSPHDNAEIRVPVRVTGIVEVPEAGSAATQGMHVSLEAAASLLEPYLSGEPAPIMGLAPEPAFDGTDGDLGEEADAEPKQDRRPREPADDDDLPAAPRVELDDQGGEVIPLRFKKDSGVMPSASGEISMEPQRDHDPDAPDKVIVMVDADLPPPSAVPEEPIELSVRKTPAVDTPAVSEAPEPEAGDAGDDDKPKRKRRGKRRKKKK